ncbi:MAG: hypothetical protein Q8K98_09305 [Bacteroidota bacterium]|nr:hypothetical protein [Bacteroidota bacterium]
MINWSRVLKIIAKILGVCLVLWGIAFGVFGIILGIDLYIPGLEAKFLAILICIYAIGTGILYWLPNENVLPHKKIYLMLTLIPFVGGIIMSAYEVLIHGIDSPFVEDLAIFWVLIMICLSLAAPVSLLLHMKSKQ